MAVLRTLGVVQTGAVATTCTSAKDRPHALQDDGVFTADDSRDSDGSDADTSDAGDSGSDDQVCTAESTLRVK